jgi:hypothetical protein
MMPGPGHKAWRYIYLCVLVLLAPTTGLSIILHEGGEPNLLTWADKPANAVVGRWSYNASFVVVSPKWILTTRHQNTNPATVDINGVTYNCIYNTTYWTGGPAGNADIRLIRLKNTDGADPNLAYAPPCTITDEMQDPNIVIGGYGKTRASTLKSYSSTPPHELLPYGYVWSTETSNIANSLHWCTNIIDGNGTVNQTYISNVIEAHFNDQGTTPPATEYEGIPAEFDSGGGWFIKDGTVWKVAGLTRGVSRHVTVNGEVQSWFRNPSEPEVPTSDPNYIESMDAVRISSYAAWIQTITTADCNGPVPVQGDLNSDCKVDMLDLVEIANQWLRTNCVSGNNFCQWADIQPDGDVDMIDFAIFAHNWLVDKSL